MSKKKSQSVTGPAQEPGPAINGAAPHDDGPENAGSAVVDTPPSIHELNAALAKSTFFAGAEVRHEGGSLPPLFPDKDRIRVGMSRIVKVVAYGEREGDNGDFTALICDVHDPVTGGVLWRGTMTIGAVMGDYFGCEPSSKDGKKKMGPPQKKVEDLAPFLRITYAGLGEAKSGRNPPRRFVIDGLYPKGSAPRPVNAKLGKRASA